MKRIFIVILSLLSIAVFSGCSNEYYPEYDSGYFRYALKTEGEKKEAYLVELTESGAEQKYLIYPSEIDGVEVCGIGYRHNLAVTVGEDVCQFGSQNLQKIYFPTMPKYEECSSSNANFSHNALAVYWHLDTEGKRMYTVGGAVFGYNYVENDFWMKDYLNAFIANVSYMYNYEGSPDDGYYWVDSYDCSLIDFIPPEPTREGYAFVGWYKDEACTMEWDFASDLTGEDIVYDSNKTYNTYGGIYLYAKWQSQ